MSLGCLWKLLCLEIQLWKALLKVGSVILLCCSALRLKHLLLPAARDKYVILQAKVKVSLLRASPQPSCISSTPLQVEEGLVFLSACPSDIQKPLLLFILHLLMALLFLYQFKLKYSLAEMVGFSLLYTFVHFRLVFSSLAFV